MSGSASGPSNITNVTGPPAYAEPYHINALQFGAEAAAQPYQPYTGVQVAGFNPQQEAGLNAMFNRGMGGSPLNAAAQTEAQKTIEGGYLDPQNNPALQNMLDYQRYNVMTQYGGALGRNFGNAGVADTVGDAMTRATAPIYEAERGRQMSAMGMAPGLASTDFTDLQAALGAGDARQALQQRQLDVPREEFMRAQMWPQRQMNLLSGSLGAGSVGSSGSQTNPYQSNPLQTALGMGTLGYLATPGINSMLNTNMNPWMGGLLGGGLGLLMS